MHLHTLAAHLTVDYELIRRDGQADDAARVDGVQLFRGWQVGDERDIGDLPTEHGQIHAERSFADSGDADQNDLGQVQLVDIAAVVVDHGEFDRLNALEILLV